MAGLRSPLRSPLRSSLYSPLVGKWGTVAALPPSYANIGGTGARSSVMTVTTDAVVGGGAVTELIDGTTGSGSFWWTAGQTLRSVRFYHNGVRRKITEVTWYQGVIATHGVWQWAGSNDGSTTTTSGGTFTLGSATPQVIATMSAETVGYLYHHLIQVSGTTNSSPFLMEAEFKITTA